METEDIIDLPASSDSGSKSKNNDFQSRNAEPSDADSQPNDSEVKIDKLNEEISKIADHGVEEAETNPAADLNEDIFRSSSALETRSVLNETIAVTEDVKISGSSIQIQNHGTAAGDGSPISNRKRDGSHTNDHDVDDSSAKRARTTDDVKQPSVHVTYNHLTRDSKAKLEELLQKWSQWHAHQYSSSHDSGELLESGEEEYFPAFHVGLDNSSAVSFWMDNQTRSQQSGEFVGLDSKSVPLYDRGYSFEGGLEILDASRCFNCGSYNHSLKECPKPRDNAAVNSARKQQKSKRNQNANSRNPTRYYQDSPGGKYDGLKPGVLDAETRKLLGLGELDPPPWLNRMRELGYPPGYLDPEDEGQPSGITIFGEEESKVEMEDGEIPERGNPDPPKITSPPRKMSVQFPGINAPIPEDADERLWEARPDYYSRNRSHHRSNYPSEPPSRGQYHEQRWSRDYRDDGPPGVEWSPTISSSSPRYNSYDSRDDNAIPRSPNLGRSFSDRGRRSPLVYESSPPSRWSPSHDYGSASFEERYSERQNGSDANYSSHRKDKHDKHHHRSWR